VDNGSNEKYSLELFDKKADEVHIGSRAKTNKKHVVIGLIAGMTSSLICYLLVISIIYSHNPFQKSNPPALVTDLDSNFYNLVVTNTGMTEEEQKLFIFTNPIETDKYEVSTHCPVSQEKQDDWLFIGCNHDGKTFITKAINENPKGNSEYVKGNADGSVVENDGNYYKSAFASLGAWDPKESNTLRNYYARYFDVDKIVSLFEINDFVARMAKNIDNCQKKEGYFHKKCEGVEYVEYLNLYINTENMIRYIFMLSEPEDNAEQKNSKM
jgi:hypothetical protein